MNILSLYDGMACGMLALLEAGVQVDRYVAYEIDKYAIQTSSHNFPMIEHRGDVFKADFTEFEGFDFVMGGSPCTKWSIAQKNNRETEASGEGWEWFQQYVRAVKEAKPKYFIYENNKSMSKAIRASIDAAFGFEAVEINSKLVSAQNRQRLYWVGKCNEDGTYSKVDIAQPEDRGILLKDILESGLTDRDKARCVTASIGRTTQREYFMKQQNTIAIEPVRIPEYGVADKSRPVTACYAYKGCGEGSLLTEAFPTNPNKQVRDYVAEPVAINTTKDGKAQYSKTGYATPCEWDEDGNVVKAVSVADGKVYAVYKVEDGFITIKGKQYPVKLIDGYYIIRKLTVRECMRLQAVPEWYEFPVSDTQAYKMLGNGWTVDVIAHLIKGCL